VKARAAARAPKIGSGRIETEGVGTTLLTRRRFTVAEYRRMVDAGILTEDDRVELIEGEIVQMSPTGSHHAAQVDRLSTVLNRVVAGRAVVRVQSPIELDDASEAEPDLALLRPRADFYAAGHPRPEDILLVVEVSDATADYDREVKVPLYARAGIPVLWRIEVPEPEAVEVYEQPSADGYGRVALARRGTQLVVLGTVLPVDDILG
jgi:Uma2 family endonuclease